MTGALTLFIAVLLNAIGLQFLRFFSKSAGDGFVIVTVAYAVIFSLIIFPKFSGRPIIPKDKRQTLFTLGWATSLASVYVLFSIFPKHISPSQVILAQTLAPLFSTFLTGELNFTETLKEKKVSLVPILLLVVLSYLNSIEQNNSQSSATIFILVATSFLFAQFFSRKLSKLNVPHFQSITRMSAFVMALMIPFSITSNSFDLNNTIAGAAFGVILMSIFFFSLKGLRNTTAIVSSTILTTAVPASLLMQSVFMERKISLSEFFLCLLYSIFIVLSLRKDKPNSQATSSHGAE